MANKKRYFVRLDSKHQPVLGSLIERTKKPKEGKFTEVFFENCCTLIDSALGGGNYSVEFKRDGVRYILIATGQSTAEAAATFLNTNYPGLATFSGINASGSIIAEDVKLGGILEMVVTKA